MKWSIPALMLLTAALALAQSTTPPTKAPNEAAPQAPATTKTEPARPAPSGTEVTKTHQDTEVQPAKKAVDVTPDVVRAAQKELNDRGYDVGTSDGRMGPRTRAAISKFQADQNLPASGKLDSNTLSKLNVGGPETIGAAPSDLGRGGKAFGHNVKEGHPVAAGKSIGTGAGRFGKKVGKGTKSTVVKGTEKVGEGISAVGEKVSGKGKKEEPKPEAAEPK
jgi:peptidoglycan hydrolase-like protein with peptidoglycan-binding domain